VTCQALARLAVGWTAHQRQPAAAQCRLTRCCQKPIVYKCCHLQLNRSSPLPFRAEAQQATRMPHKQSLVRIRRGKGSTHLDACEILVQSWQKNRAEEQLAVLASTTRLKLAGNSKTFPLVVTLKLQSCCCIPACLSVQADTSQTLQRHIQSQDTWARSCTRSQG
jgi:hypothetical protein